jgi:hypothetical protein
MEEIDTSGPEYLSTGVKVCNATHKELVMEGDRLRKLANDLLAEHKQTGKELTAEILAAHTRAQELYTLAYSKIPGGLPGGSLQ